MAPRVIGKEIRNPEKNVILPGEKPYRILARDLNPSNNTAVDFLGLGFFGEVWSNTTWTKATIHQLNKEVKKIWMEAEMRLFDLSEFEFEGSSKTCLQTILKEYYAIDKRSTAKKTPQELNDLVTRLIAMDHFVTTMFNDEGRASEFAESTYPGIDIPGTHSFFASGREKTTDMLLDIIEEEKDGQEQKSNLGLTVPNSRHSLVSLAEEYNSHHSFDDEIPGVISIPGRIDIFHTGIMSNVLLVPANSPYHGRYGDSGEENITTYLRVEYLNK